MPKHTPPTSEPLEFLRQIKFLVPLLPVTGVQVVLSGHTPQSRAGEQDTALVMTNKHTNKTKKRMGRGMGFSWIAILVKKDTLQTCWLVWFGKGKRSLYCQAMPIYCYDLL